MLKRLTHRMMVYMSRQMIACDEAGYLVSYRSENSLGLIRWWKLQMHLITCHLCRKYARQIRQLNDLVHRYGEACSHEECAYHLTGEAEQRIEHAVQREIDIGEF